MKYYLYILRSKTANKYYSGISQNPQRRLEYHNTIERGFTSCYRPWKIVFIKEYNSKSEAMSAEKKIKSWKSRKMIEKIINGKITL
jgi:putative endonuclease